MSREEEEKRWTELQAAEARFRTIFENAPIMINSFDREGHVVLWNQACVEQLGYTREELDQVEDPLSLFYPDPALRDRVLGEITRASGTFAEFQVKRKDGRFVHQMWANYILPDESLISVGYDVSAIREAREKLQAANLNLEQKVEERTRELDRERAKLISSSKFAALGEMAGGIAHEVNNPLAVIAGLVDQLQALDGEETPELRREMLTNIRTSITRISKITAGLRAISRDASRDPVIPYPAHDLTQEIIGFCRERFKNNEIRLEVEVSGHDFVLDCRPVEIGQVLLNLLNNAFDAVQQVREKWVRVEVGRSGKDVLVRVTDSGKGIPTALEERIFLPFFTTKPIGQGTGIGLSISRGIAEAHGGTLRYELADGHTSFVLQLPKPPSTP